MPASVAAVSSAAASAATRSSRFSRAARKPVGMEGYQTLSRMCSDDSSPVALQPIPHLASANTGRPCTRFLCCTTVCWREDILYLEALDAG